MVVSPLQKFVGVLPVWFYIVIKTEPFEFSPSLFAMHAIVERLLFLRYTLYHTWNHLSIPFLKKVKKFLFSFLGLQNASHQCSNAFINGMNNGGENKCDNEGAQQEKRRIQIFHPVCGEHRHKESIEPFIAYV